MFGRDVRVKRTNVLRGLAMIINYLAGDCNRILNIL